MQARNAPGVVTITARDYTAQVRGGPPRLVLADPDGRIWSQLSLLASLDATDRVDESIGIPEATLRHADDGVVEVEQAVVSSAWERKAVTVRCFEDHLEVEARITGSGRLSTASLLGGRAVTPQGTCGLFGSSIEFTSLFSPGPSEPVQVVRPAQVAATLGVVGDATAGRVHGLFSPPPLCLALGRGQATGPTDIPDTDWWAVSVVAPVADLRFTELRYLPMDGGFRLELEYDGHTHVHGSFTTPTLVLRRAADPWTALRDHRDDLVSRGLAPGVSHTRTQPWWRQPLFSGWGAQCAEAPVSGHRGLHPSHLVDLGPGVVPAGTPTARDLARQDVYDALLARLEEHGVVPGTVVIDDKWQVAYGSAEPDPERWPDLKAWIAKRHAAGQRVLLWWKAWDPAGIPADECVRTPAGVPVAVDPGNPRYLARLDEIVRRLLAPDGLDADGLKVDFTQHTPAGQALTAHCGPDGAPVSWGLAALHRLLGAIHRAAHDSKPDALVETHTPHPSFADVTDMIRLDDVLERDAALAAVPAVDQLAFRSAVARAALPHHPLDTDQWPMVDRAAWRAYVEQQPSYGVPALYYTERIDRSGEVLGDADLALVAETWRRYRAGLTQQGPDLPG